MPLTRPSWKPFRNHLYLHAAFSVLYFERNEHVSFTVYKTYKIPTFQLIFAETEILPLERPKTVFEFSGFFVKCFKLVLAVLHCSGNMFGFEFVLWHTGPFILLMKKDQRQYLIIHGLKLKFYTATYTFLFFLLIVSN